METSTRMPGKGRQYFRFLVITVTVLVGLLCTGVIVAGTTSPPTSRSLALSIPVQTAVRPAGGFTPTPCPAGVPCDTATATATCPPGVPCNTAVATATCRPAQCGTPTATPTETPSCPVPCLPTSTPTETPSCPAPCPPTSTPTPTCHPGGNCGPTPTCVPGGNNCGTSTPTLQNSTSTNTPTNTSTRTQTSTATRTQINTSTRTQTSTATRTATVTVTRTATATSTCVVLGHYTATVVVGTATILPGTVDLGNHCDDCLSQLVFPFPVQFYGEEYGKAVVSSNGNIQFVPESSSSASPCLPNTELNTAIMVYQGDLDTSGAGEGIFSATLGNAPNRTFVVEWRAHYGGGRTDITNVEVIFTENSSTIRMVYGDNTDEGLNQVSGMQLGQGEQYDQYSCHAPLLTARKAIDWIWFPPIVFCTPTPTATRPPTATATSTACVTTVLSNGFESGTLESYTSVVATCVPGGCGWTNVTTAAHTGTRSLFAPDVSEPSDQQLTSPPFTIPGSQPKLIFWHRYALEHPLWDGGELEISPNGGPWATVTPAAITPTYPAGVIPGTFMNPLVGKKGWTDKNPSWPAFDQITVDLTAYAGIPNTRFRFRLGTDHGNAGTGPALGWWIDDITVTGLCNTPTATRTRTVTPTRTVTGTPTPPCTPAPSGLTHWYPLDETTGSIANEVVFGATAFELNSPAHVPGKVAGGLSFNGINQWARVFPPWNSPALGTGDFSVDTWINVPASSLNGIQVFLDGRSFAPRGFEMFLYNGRLGVQLADQLPPPSGYSNYIAATQGGLANPGWHLVAVTVQRVTNGGTLWVDGVSMLTFTPRMGNLTSGAPLWIGRHHPNASSNVNLWFQGSLDEIEFFRRALTPNEVINLYNAGSGGKCKPETATPTVTPTPGPCWWCMTDVPVGSTFYLHITNLAYQGVVNGYLCGSNPNEPCIPPENYAYYRPGNDVTRGQIAKIVSLSAGLNDDVTGQQTYTDVPPGHTFWTWIERLSMHAVMGGYPCGGEGEPCDSEQRPYFRPYNNATRGQLSKIVSNAAGFSGTPSGQTFTDVPPGHPFYDWIERLAAAEIMGGYKCGGEGEPCDDEQRPYFRPFNNVTRGQAAKIVANTFWLDDWIEP
jgi:hypothetical protein